MDTEDSRNLVTSTMSSYNPRRPPPLVVNFDDESDVPGLLEEGRQEESSSVDDLLEVDDDEDEVSSYFDRLCSLGLLGASSETQNLSLERETVREGLKEVSFNHIDSFLKTNDVLDAVIDGLESMKGRSATTRGHIPTVVNSINSFGQESTSISQRWRDTSRMLSKHQSMIELLEVPQVMETCVKTGNYEDALRLYDHVHRYTSKYPDVPLMASLSTGMESVRKTLASEIMTHLSSSVQLPACMKYVSILKRLEHGSRDEEEFRSSPSPSEEASVRIKFLSARDSYLRSLLKELPKQPSLLHVTKFVECLRVNLFDITTQYMAVFPTSETSAVSLATNQHPQSITDVSKILPSWLLFRVEEALVIIQNDLLSCIETEPYQPIDSVVDPCLYFGLSLSRLGIDIRPRLMTMFNNIFLRRFSRVLGRGVSSFSKSLESFAWSHEKSAPRSEKERKSVGDVPEPPRQLLEMKPLATLTNCFLSALNELRIQAPLMSPFRVRDVLSDSLSRATDSILIFIQRQTSKNIQEKVSTLYVNYFISHITEAFYIVFPSSSLAKSLGVSLIDFAKWVKKSRSEGVVDNRDSSGLNVGHLPLDNVLNITGKEYLFDPFLPQPDSLKDDEDDTTLYGNKGYEDVILTPTSSRMMINEGEGSLSPASSVATALPESSSSVKEEDELMTLTHDSNDREQDAEVHRQLGEEEMEEILIVTTTHEDDQHHRYDADDVPSLAACRQEEVRDDNDCDEKVSTTSGQRRRKEEQQKQQEASSFSHEVGEHKDVTVSVGEMKRLKYEEDDEVTDEKDKKDENPKCDTDKGEDDDDDLHRPGKEDEEEQPVKFLPSHQGGKRGKARKAKKE